MPYLADGALQLLLHAATVQAEALHRSSNSCVMPGLLPAAAAPQPWGVAAGAMDQLQQQQGVLRVGLWVCCWGGCPGLNLPEAAALHGKLQELPCCRMTGCESVNITSDADLQGVAQLQGLEALGICFVNDSSSNIAAKMPDRLRAAGVDVGGQAEGVAAATTAGDMGNDTSSSSNSSSANCGLGVLATLACTLKQLSIRGSPPGGWGSAASSTPPSAQLLLHQPQQFAEAAAQQQLQLARQEGQLQQLALANLTGLTKLSLQKDWAQPALPLGPIAVLTLLQELALERHGLQHPSELSCLGTLTNLRVLSLVLAVTADELQDTGSWHHAGGPAHWLQRQEAEGAAAAVMERLSTLKVQDSSAAVAAMECDAGSGSAVCSCCCSCHPGHLQRLAGSGLSPAHDAADMLHEVLACPVLSNAGSPALLDWAWLAKLQHLENAWLQVRSSRAFGMEYGPCMHPSSVVCIKCWRRPCVWCGHTFLQTVHCTQAWPCTVVGHLGWPQLFGKMLTAHLHAVLLLLPELQVPHLDLTCLPSSLVELDAQQPRDLTRVSITCSHNRGINLPRLQHLVLPHMLQPSQQPRMQDADAGHVQNPLQQPASMASGNSSEDPISEVESDSDGGSDGAATDLQHHWEAAVLLSLALGAPELKELELVQWQPPSVSVLAAARSFPWLKLLSVVGPDGDCDELQASVSAARAQQGLRSVDVQLQEHLVLSSFPWSSVLSAR